MNKKKILIISSIVFILIIATLFISYGFITADISGNETSKNTVFNGQILKIEYSDGTETLTSNQGVFTPGSTIVKTFTIKNAGNVSIKYSINLDNITNTFERKEDITYELTSNDIILKNGINEAKGIFPDNKIAILNNDILNKGQSKTYTLKINYLNSEENQIIDSGKSLSANILIDEAITSINKLIVYGNSVQNGTPTPEAPIEVESVGELITDGENAGKYAIPIVSRGKNLIPFPYYHSNRKVINGVTFVVNEDRSITVNGTATENAVFYLVNIDNPLTLEKSGLQVGDRVTASKTFIDGEFNPATRVTINWYNANGVMNEGGYLIGNANTVIPVREGFYAWAIYLLVEKGQTINNSTILVQLEKGEIATEYEPYQEPVTTNIYLKEPLRKIGDYTDYIDFANKKVVRNVGNVDLGELSWEVPSGYSGYMYYNRDLSNEMNYKTTTPLGLCTAYTINPSYGGWAIADTYEGLTINRYTGALNIKDTRFLNDANAFKESNKGVYFNYLLETPTEETIELPSIITHEGTNIIEVDTNILPSNIEVEYDE